MANQDQSSNMLGVCIAGLTFSTKAALYRMSSGVGSNHPRFLTIADMDRRLLCTATLSRGCFAWGCVCARQCWL